MSFLQIVYSIIILPLKLFFELLYTTADSMIFDPGLSIMVLSLAMNLLVLPLYRRADAMQEEERDIEARLHRGVAHIRKTFKGDEQMLVLQTYYRQNNYKPTYVFKGAASLFLEIPFFIAAYQFLSNLDALKGVPFGLLANLGAPDALIAIGGLHINLLPMVMTAVNLVSCVVFSKGYPLKTKLQLYGMAVFFLFFLYDSPSGLVFYWTLNNVFSLVKTIFYKLKNAKTILRYLAGTAGLGLFAGAVYMFYMHLWDNGILLSLLCVACVLPTLLALLKKRAKGTPKPLTSKPDRTAFFAGTLYLTVLTGGLIPSAVLKSSPQEFVNVFSYYDPRWYVVSSLCLAAGCFLVWLGVFYGLAGEKSKLRFEFAVLFSCCAATANYMLFGKKLGIISNELQYKNGLVFSAAEQIINVAAVAVIALLVWLLLRRRKRFSPRVLTVAILAVAVMSGINVADIGSSVSQLTDSVSEAQLSEKPSFSLSQTGNNVVVLMMDRAMGEYIPYLFNERPQLKESFSGFTYYPHTISFGGYTNFGSPPLYGGYEYTPVEMNLRDGESLRSKHNEALKVMPVIFDKAGYEVTVCDPTYAGYRWIPNLSIYDAYPDINTYSTKDYFADRKSRTDSVEANKLNFFLYSVMKSLPLCTQSAVYDKGNYNRVVSQGQVVNGLHTSYGISESFLSAYTALQNLSGMTEIKAQGDTFLLMSNDTTHDAMLLQEPEYAPADKVDNSAFDAEHLDRFTVDGRTLAMDEEIQYRHYQSNMAALIEIGRWLDFLRENDVYDNTRIIIVADHGDPLHQLDDALLESGESSIFDTEFYFPLLMVKDFNAEEFTSSDEFMTNADVPTMALAGLVENPVNPFTGKPIDDSEKNAHAQYVFGSYQWDIRKNNGNTFMPGIWFAVDGDPRDADSWLLVSTNSVLPPNY